MKMNWIKFVLGELKRILEIKNNIKRLENYDKLAYIIIKKPKIKKMGEFNWVYFYPVLGYDNEGNEILGPRLGKIHKDIFKTNKKEIEKLRAAGKIEELKKYF